MSVSGLNSPGVTKCDVCKKDFELLSDNRYTTSVMGLEFDAFDCPHCGCQNRLGVRGEYQESTDYSYLDAFFDQLLGNIVGTDEKEDSYE